MTFRVADYVADWIARKASRKTVYSVTGAGIMHLTDGLARNSNVRSVFLHHEQAVTMAAEAHSRLLGRACVAMVSTGPGATNALTGVAGAWQDSVPLVVISGQVKQSETSYLSGVPGLRQFGVQELNILPIVSSVTKFAHQVAHPDEVPEILERAYHLAHSGRPGPVWVEIPLDIQSAPLGQTKRAIVEASHNSSEQFSQASVQSVAEALSKSSRPVVLIGQGVRISGAHEAVAEFCREFRIPVVSTYLGLDGYTPHDELFIGAIGVKGERGANLVLQKSDFLLILGSSLHTSVLGYNHQNFAPHAAKWIVDLDETSHKKVRLSKSTYLQADLRQFVPLLFKSVTTDIPNRNWSEWAGVALQLRKLFPTCAEEYQLEPEGVNIYSVIDQVSKWLRPGDVAVSDAGSAFYATSQGLILNSQCRHLPSGAMATMGYSVPGAIGASIASPSSTIYAITGDGSLLQNIQELAQVVHLNLPIIVVVLNNAGYLSIRASQRNYFEGRLLGTDSQSGLGFPDLAQVARSFGIRVLTIHKLDELKDLGEQLENQSGPLFLNIACPPNQAIIPTVGSRVEPDGSMVSNDLEDMTPRLDPALLHQIMDPNWGLQRT